MFARLSLSVLLTATLVLAGCSKPKQAQKAAASLNFAARDVLGSWAWIGQENCWGKGNYIAFEQPTGQLGHYRVTVNHFEQEPLIVEDVQISTTRQVVDKTDRTVLIVRYELVGQTYEEQYLLNSHDEMRVLRSLVNGQPQQLASVTDPNRVLVRCKAVQPAS